MFSKFFIEHPRFAFVISIVITIAGLVAVWALPVNQYPNITPGVVSVTAVYPGADALTVQETVIQPIETQLNGVKKMLYMSSTATDTGAATINVTFDIGTDGDLNTVNTQNRVNWASAQLPEEVRRQSVIVKEKSPNMLLVIVLTSPNGEYDSLFLNNYLSIYIKDELARIPGVGDVAILGELKYSMRLWLDPDKLAYLGMTVGEVQDALKAQNVQVSAGALGDAPTDKNQLFRYTLQTKGRLSDPEEFKKIVIRSTDSGEQVKIGDVATVELGAESYASTGTFNNKPAALLAIYQLNDANGLNIAKACYQKLDELKAYFPPGIEYQVPFDTTQFITASIDEVVVTLFEAVFLVILITYLFLQDWRSTLVPTVAIPVSLIGTFAVMQVIGFSINLITLFGLILAIGIVVDDAIVVIENINRLMDEEKLSPKDAAIKSMEQVTGPVVATTAVLLAMFVPVCFLPGITGVIYRQFGITIAVAVTISSINALTLSPALSALILKPGRGEKNKKFIFFRWFDDMFDFFTRGYSAVVRVIVRRAFLVMLCYAGLTAGCYFLYGKLPTAFIPDEDQGKLFINLQLPDAASLPRSIALTDQVCEIARQTPGVDSVIAVPGFSILNSSQASNNSLVIVNLKPWSERQTPALHQDGIMRTLQAKYAQMPQAVIAVFGMPTIQGVGNTGGFSFVIEDTSGTYPERLEQAVATMCMEANKSPVLYNVFSTFSAKVPQYYLNINREKAMKLGVGMDDINQALQSLTAYSYVNDFNKFGKVYKVEMQAQKQFRERITDINNFFVKNIYGDMVPLGTLVSVETRLSPQYLNRFNMYSSVTLNGTPRPGYSSGEAMAEMERLAAEYLPGGMKYEWTDMSYQEAKANAPVHLGPVSVNMVAVILGLAMLFMYLFLVAQYESWMIPMAVLLSVPIAFFGSLLFLYWGDVTNNLYTQVGFILLFGVACKTAILIVEFAKESHENDSMSIVEAAEHAAKLRFRAVLMTAVSFILGVMPLVMATGAGAASRVSLGTAVFGGMLVAAIGGTLLIPCFYVVVQRLIEWRKK